MSYDLIYVPIRTVVFLLLVAGLLGVEFDAGGLLPGLAILATFIPVVWGIGAVTAAVVLTFKRGGGAVGIATFALTVTSGTYFPISLFPDWVETLARLNPLAIALDGMRATMLGGAGWMQALETIAMLMPFTDHLADVRRGNVPVGDAPGAEAGIAGDLLMRYARSANVVVRALRPGEGAVALHLETGAYHGLNDVGSLVWELLATPSTTDRDRPARARSHPRRSPADRGRRHRIPRAAGVQRTGSTLLVTVRRRHT